MSKAEKVLKEVETLTQRKYLPIIGPRKGRILLEVVRKIKPNSVLEIGTLVGYSAIVMGKELGRDAHLTTIEMHADEAQMAKENIRRAQIPPTVEVLVGDAIECIPRLEGSFDLVFIDADKGEYLYYLRLVEDKLHTGSVIVADNTGIFMNQMRDYLDYVRSSGKYRSKSIHVAGDAIEISTKI